MNDARLYLDHNASSTLRPEARAAMIDALDRHGNASSVHREGRQARRIVEDAREQVAALVGARPADIVFTSGATEANNMALSASWDAILHAGIEHESIVSPAKSSSATVTELAVRSDGTIDPDCLSVALAATSGTGRTLLTLQMANNETGVCQDLAAAALAAREQGITIHTDAVQACGRLDVRFYELDVDLMSLSSHKLGGPMGIGALVVRDGYDLRSLLVGGGQERRRRAGTENVAAIAGFGAAAEAAKSQLGTEASRLRKLRDQLEAVITEIVPDALVVGNGAPRLPNTVCVALPGDLAETTVIKLDLAGIAISAGSACSSGKVGASHVLQAMGLPEGIARTAIRISLGWNTSETSLEEFLTRFRNLKIPASMALA